MREKGRGGGGKVGRRRKKREADETSKGNGCSPTSRRLVE